MADASNGVSGSNSSQNAADADRAAATAAAQQAAADKAAADAVAAAAIDPVNAAPVDLTISPTALSQLNSFTVDAVPNLASFPTLGGIPAAATYADVAQALAAKPATPAIAEYNAWSPSFSITPNDPAAVATAQPADVSINLGMNFNGYPNATIEARMGVAPASITGFASVSFNNTLDSLSLSTTLGPFGPNSTPNYNIAVKSATALSDAYSFDFNAGATFNNQGFQNADVTGKLSRSFSQNLSGYVQGGLAFDNQGLSRITGEGGLNFNQNGLGIGLTGRGSFDVRTGDTSGYIGVRAGGTF